MASIFKDALKRAFQPAAERILDRLHGSKPRVLTYHRFPEDSQERFAQQCAYLRSRYNPVSMDQIVSAIGGRTPLPPRSVAITIDDGYGDVYHTAAPVLRRYRIPATVYVVSGFLDRQVWMWWDRITYSFVHSPRSRVELHLPGLEPRQFPLGTPEERRTLAGRVSVYLARRDNSESGQWCRDLAASLEANPPDEPVPPYEPLSWEQARELASQDIAIGSHTATHQVLGTLRDHSAKQTEINASRQRIEEMLDWPVRHFCFPNGGVADFSHADLALVRQAGYASSVTTYVGLITEQTDPFQIPRINSAAGLERGYFRMRTAGSFHFNENQNLPVRVPEL